MPCGGEPTGALGLEASAPSDRGLPCHRPARSPSRSLQAVPDGPATLWSSAVVESGDKEPDRCPISRLKSRGIGDPYQWRLSWRPTRPPMFSTSTRRTTRLTLSSR